MAASFRDPGRVEFVGEIRCREGGGSYVEFPHDVEKLYGVKGRVPVKAAFDGLPYRGSMVRMGTPRHILLILKEIREKLGKGEGDRVKVTVDLDGAPRTVELAPDVAAAFRKAKVLDAFEKMSYSHRREYHLWIEEAKQAETRARRIAKAAADLAARK